MPDGRSDDDGLEGSYQIIRLDLAVGRGYAYMEQLRVDEEQRWAERGERRKNISMRDRAEQVVHRGLR